MRRVSELTVAKSRGREGTERPRTDAHPPTDVRHPPAFDPRLQQLGHLGVNEAPERAVLELAVELKVARRARRGRRRGLDGERRDEEVDDGGRR